MAGVMAVQFAELDEQDLGTLDPTERLPAREAFAIVPPRADLTQHRHVLIDINITIY